MVDFLLALQFLTILPVKVEGIKEKALAKSLIYFPFVGLLLGLILIGINNLLNIFGFEQLTINTIVIISLIILTGGIHLDGLADTFDAFLSRKDKKEMLEIMRDSHMGVMGGTCLISTILLKITLLFSISVSLKIISLLLMCILSRWSLVLAIFLFPYARQEGKAKIFIQEINLKIFILSTIVALFCAIILWQLKGLLIMAIIAISTYLMGKFINKKIDGITGDTLGALNELTEVIILFSICILEKFNLWMV